MELSIVVPCYNESRNLERLIGAFRDAIQEQPGIELVLVDNGSRDDTPEVMQTLLSRPENRFARCVTVDVNQGYGYGILFGLRKATGKFLAWTHADLQTPPEDVLLAFEKIQSLGNPEQALVRGRRRGRPFFDQLFTTAMGWYASYALGSRFFDVNAQPKLFHRSLLAKLEQAPHDFTLDLYLLFVANRLGLEVQMVDVRFDRRTEGVAKGGGTLKGKYKLIRRTLAQIGNLRRTLGVQPSRTANLEDVQPMSEKAA